MRFKTFAAVLGVEGFRTKSFVKKLAEGGV
jgi:hypothetical protein